MQKPATAAGSRRLSAAYRVHDYTRMQRRALLVCGVMSGCLLVEYWLGLWQL